MRSKKWILIICASFAVCAITTFSIYKALQIDTQKVEEAVKEKLSQYVSARNWKINFKKDLFKKSFEVEITTQNPILKNLPIQVKALRIVGDYSFFSGFKAKEIAIQTANESNTDYSLKGGFTAQINEEGYTLNLTDLEIQSGALFKKMGYPMELLVKNDIQKIIFAGQEWNFKYDPQVPFQFTIPLQKKTLTKNKIPLKFISEFSATGDLSLELALTTKKDDPTKLQISGKAQTDDLWLNLSEGSLWWIQSQRGIGKLSMNSQFGNTNPEEKNLNKFALDLTHASFDLSTGKIFKADGEKMLFKAEENIASWKLSLELEEGNAIVALALKDKIKISADWQNVPIALFPKIFGTEFAGSTTGQGEWQLTPHPLGDPTLDNWNLKVQNADLETTAKWQMGKLASQGLLHYQGSFEVGDSAIKKAKGTLNLTESTLKFAELYKKESGEALELALNIHDKNEKELQIEFKSKSSSLNAEGTFAFNNCSHFKCSTAKEKLLFEFNNYSLTTALWASPIVLNGKLKKSFLENSLSLEDMTLTLAPNLNLGLDVQFTNKKSKLHARLEGKQAAIRLVDPFLWTKSFIKEYPESTLDMKVSAKLEDEDNSQWNVLLEGPFKNKKWALSEYKIEKSLNNKKQLALEGRAEIDFDSYQSRNEEVQITSTAQIKNNLSLWGETSQKNNFSGEFSGELVFASHGFNMNEWLKNSKARLTGSLSQLQGGLYTLLDHVFEEYSKERSGGPLKKYADDLYACFPSKLNGKVDVEYADSKWDFSPSLAQGAENDSMLRLQGTYADNLNISFHYLPGPQCSAKLSTCLGDAFPKGGISLAINGKVDEPETELDFAFVDKALEKCNEKNNNTEQDSSRILAGKTSSERGGSAPSQKISAAEQAEQIRSLKEVYRERTRSP